MILQARDVRNVRDRFTTLVHPFRFQFTAVGGCGPTLMSYNGGTMLHLNSN